jgi:hypothetical protein
MIHTEAIDALFLELSQFTNAKTKRELKAESLLMRAANSIRGVSEDARQRVARDIDVFLMDD